MVIPHDEDEVLALHDGHLDEAQVEVSEEDDLVEVEVVEDGKNCIFHILTIILILLIKLSYGTKYNW